MNSMDKKKRNLVRICVVVGFIIYGVAVTIYCDIKAKKFKGFNLNSVSVYMPKEYYSEPDYHSNGLFVIDNSQCFVIAIDFDNVSEKDKEVCDFISWDKVDYLYKAKNEGDVAYAIQLLSPMFSYHRYTMIENKHTLKQYLYTGEHNGPGQIVYYTTSDPETHVLYAIFDHDKDKVFTKKDNENILGCIITRHK